MISPLPAGLSTLRQAAPPRPHSGSAGMPELLDVFNPSGSSSLGPAEAVPHLAGDGKKFVRKAVVTACLVTTGMAGMMAGIPSAAAAQLQHGGLVPSKDPAIRQLVASSLVTGRTPPGTVEERLSQLKPAVRTLLSGLPADVQKSYVDLDAGGRRWVSSQIGGTTPTLFGKIKNRPSFISGHFLIINVFDQLKEQIAGEVKKGTIPLEAQPRINATVDRLKALKPAQRQILTQALETEFLKK